MWGRGEYGRLGLGDRSGSSRLRATLVKAMEGHSIVQARTVIHLQGQSSHITGLA